MSFLVPIMLYGMRKCHLRKDDEPPRVIEIVLPLIVWSLLFELIFPRSKFWSKWVTGDPHDIFYVLGACVAMFIWEWYYSPLFPRKNREGN